MAPAHQKSQSAVFSCRLNSP